MSSALSNSSRPLSHAVVACTYICMRRTQSKRHIGKKRCPWVPAGNTLYERYHDTEWGRPVRDDQKFFEFLILESAQAGLSWETILRHREGYQQAFADFDAKKVSRFSHRDVTRLMQDARIIRNRLKIESTITNARLFLSIRKEFGSFSKYAWGFVGGKVEYSPKGKARTTSLSAEALAADLKRRGFRFFGPTIAYAFMQATGLVNDHAPGCFLHRSQI